jgi:hypothetical protein
MNYGNNLPIGFPVYSPSPQGSMQPRHVFVSQPLIPVKGYTQTQYLQNLEFPQQRVLMFPPQLNYHGVPNSNNGVYYQNVVPIS